MPEAIVLHGRVNGRLPAKKSQKKSKRTHGLSVALVTDYVLLLLMRYTSNIAGIFARDASALDERREHIAFAQQSKLPRSNVITMPPMRG